MTAQVDYCTNLASEAEIAEHLWCCDVHFCPILSERVKIQSYALKIFSKATRFEAWSNGTLVGLVAAYCNNQETRIAHITSVSVFKEWTGKGIAASLLGLCVVHCRASGMDVVGLEVGRENIPAIKLYENCGFISCKTNEQQMQMTLSLRI